MLQQKFHAAEFTDLHVSDRCAIYRARLKLTLNQHKHPLRCVRSV